MTDQTILKKDHTSTYPVLESGEDGNALGDTFPFLLEEGCCLLEKPISSTKDEIDLLDEFYKKMQDVQEKNNEEFQKTLNLLNVNWTRSSLERIKYVVDQYLAKGMRLSVYYNDKKETTVDLVFEEIIGILQSTTTTTSGGVACRFSNSEYLGYGENENEETKEENIIVIQDIVSSLLLRGGKVNRHLFRYDRIAHSTEGFINSSAECFDEYLSSCCKEIKNKIESIACESIVNASGKIRKNLEVEMDNIFLYVNYPQNCVIQPAEVMNKCEVEKLGLRIFVLGVGSSVARIEKIGEVRNYTDLADGSNVVLTFHTSLGELEVRLYPDMQGLIKVEVKDQDKWKKLKNCEEEVGKNCLLGGLPVIQTIDQGAFARSGGLIHHEVISESDNKKVSWAGREELRKISDSRGEIAR